MFSPISVLHQFARDETGTVMAETVIVLPMLLWSYLALFVYWDSFRSMNTVQKAAYTISDTLSREMVQLPATYFDGLRDVMDHMIDDQQSAKLRVTSITYNLAAKEYQVLWSYSPGSALPELTTATLLSVKHRLPNMANADSATIVETAVDYQPAFDVGMNAMTMHQFIVTRPRFVAPTCMIGRPCNGAT